MATFEVGGHGVPIGQILGANTATFSLEEQSPSGQADSVRSKYAVRL
jgi:hypothetical protein